MIKSVDFISEDAKKEGEQTALAELLSKFTNLMANKLMRKVELGVSGWDTQEYKEIIQQKLHNNLERGDMIDVANLAMLLWNLNQE